MTVDRKLVGLLVENGLSERRACKSLAVYRMSIRFPLTSRMCPCYTINMRAPGKNPKSKTTKPQHTHALKSIDRYRKDFARFGLTSFQHYNSASDYARQFQRCTLLIEDPQQPTSSDSSLIPTTPAILPVGK